MSLNWPKPGLDHVPSYQVSGIPYITRSVMGGVPQRDRTDTEGTTLKVEFPFVTSWVMIANISDRPNMHVPKLVWGFSANGVAGPSTAMGLDNNGQITSRGFQMPPSSSTPCLPLRCKDIYLTTFNSQDCTFQLIAGLTNISRDQFPALTASNGFEGVG